MKYKSSIAIVTLSILSVLPSTAFAEIHNGMNVVSNGTVYFVQPYNGGAAPPPDMKPTLLAYPSPAVFLSYGFNSWNVVVPASDEDLALNKSGLLRYADGSLVNDKGTVYLINQAGRYGFTDSDVFLKLGYRWENVITGDTSYIHTSGTVPATGAHLAGTLVNDSGTIYIMHFSGKLGFPSMDVFNSWGFKLNQVVSANDADRVLQGSVVWPRIPGMLSPIIAQAQ